MSDEEAVPDPMEDLRREYLAEQGERFRAIAGAWRALRDHGQGEERLKTLSRLAHNLAGSAGLYGLPGISDVARRLERALGPLAAHAAPEAAQVAQIAVLIAELERDVQALLPGAAPPAPLS